MKATKVCRDPPSPEHMLHWSAYDLFSYTVKQEMLATPSITQGTDQEQSKKRHLGDGLCNWTAQYKDRLREWNTEGVKESFQARIDQMKQEILEKNPKLCKIYGSARQVLLLLPNGKFGLMYINHIPLYNLICVGKYDRDPFRWISEYDEEETSEEFDEGYRRIKSLFDDPKDCPTKEAVANMRKTIEWRTTDEDFTIPEGAPTIMVPPM